MAKVAKVAKVLKQDYVNVITYFFAKQNKRLTNVGRFNLTQLKETITKYDIPFDSVFQELKNGSEDEDEKKVNEMNHTFSSLFNNLNVNDSDDEVSFRCGLCLNMCNEIGRTDYETGVSLCPVCI